MILSSDDRFYTLGKLEQKLKLVKSTPLANTNSSPTPKRFTLMVALQPKRTQDVKKGKRLRVGSQILALGRDADLKRMGVPPRMLTDRRSIGGTSVIPFKGMEPNKCGRR